MFILASFECRLATVFCCLGSINCSDSSEAPTKAPAPTQAPAAPFNIFECADSMQSRAQTDYVCYKNKKLFPILKYAENLSRHWCEEHFKHDRWNCSSFSVLKTPQIAQNSSKFTVQLME